MPRNFLVYPLSRHLCHQVTSDAADMRLVQCTPSFKFAKYICRSRLTAVGKIPMPFIVFIANSSRGINYRYRTPAALSIIRVLSPSVYRSTGCKTQESNCGEPRWGCERLLGTSRIQSSELLHAAGKVTVGPSSYWQCVTAGLSTYGLKAYV